MSGRLFDRLTGSAAFAVLHAVSAVIVLPILFFGLVVLLPMLVVDLVVDGADAETLALAALPLGGLLGVVGLLRARWGAARPERHNVTATLIFLAIGAITALTVCGLVLGPALLEARALGSPRPTLSLLFAGANGVWILSGLAAMRRLDRRFAERTGEAIDVLPVLLLLVVLALASTVVLVTAANA